MDKKLQENMPIYMQIMNRVRDAVASGELAPGDRVASVREMAADFEVNPNTMQRALNELEREGLLVGGGTSGRTVTEDRSILEQARSEVVKALALECAERFKVFGVSPGEAAAMLLALGAEQEEV